MTEQQLLAAAAKIVASTYRNPSDWFVEYVTGGGTDSGVSVNHTSALTYSSVFACVDIISSDVASLPLNDTQLDEEGNKTVNSRSQVQWLLNHEPNQSMTAFSFRKTLQSHVLLQGNGYAAIQRDIQNRPTRLIPIHPLSVEEVFHDVDGRLWYKIHDMEDYIAAGNMLHVVGLSDDGINGISVVTKARNSWGLGLAEEKHGSSHFKNGASPKVILKTPRNLSEEEAEVLLKLWADKQEGTKNAGKTALAAGGLEIETVSVSNEDAQWLESRKFQRSEVATWFSLPEHMINGEKGPYNSTIAENQAYLRRTLKKHLCAWEQETERKLVPDRERRTTLRRLRHDTGELLSSDPETKASIAVSLVAGEIATRNEARRQLGMNRHDDPSADTLSSPNTRTDNAPSDDGEPVPDESAAKQHRVISSRMSSLISAEGKAVVNGAKRAGNFVNWLDGFYAKRVSDMAKELDPLVDMVSSTQTAEEVAQHHADMSKSMLLEVAGWATDADLVEHVTEATGKWDIRAAQVANSIMGVE